jgi:hypothetical protein
MRIHWRLTCGAVALGSLISVGCSPDIKGGAEVDPGAAISTVVITPSNITIAQGELIQFAYYARTVGGDSVVPRLDWVANGGELGSDGEYTGTMPGTFRVTGLTHQAPHIGDTVTVVVTPLVAADSVVVSPALVTLQPGRTQVFTATAFQSDGSVVPQAVTWLATGGTINASGSYDAGNTTGTFRVDAIEVGTGQLLDTARVIISNTAATLQSVVVTPATVSVATGGSRQFTANGRYSDGSLLPITVTWIAASGSITSGGLYTAGQATGTFAVIGRDPVSGLADTSQVTVTGVLASIDLTPVTVALNYGGSQQYTVFGRQTDGTVVPVSVTFTATGGTVTAGGYYTAGQTAGTYRVIAREASSGLADTSSVTVQAPPATIVGLNLLPNSATLLTGGTKQFTAQNVWSDGTTSSTSNVSYLVTAGSITSAGLYTAPQTAGSYMVIGVSGAGGFRDTTVVVVNSPATLASIQVAPASVTVGVGGVVPFVATGTLTDGTTTTVSVAWSVNGGGTINSAGLFTAGSVAGQYKVIARLTGGALADTADVFISATPPAASNEPSGYAPFAIHRLSEIPVWGRAVGGVLGSWYAYPSGGGARLSIKTDPSAPVSPDSVIAALFPTGWVGGTAPVNWGGWDATDTKYRRVYLSVWIKIQGPDYENHLVGTKAGFIGVGMDPNVGNNQLVLHLNNGTGVMGAIQSQMQVDFKIQGIPQPNGTVNRIMYQNVNRSPLFTCGTWHHWELVLIVNTMGQADGQLFWWIDGTKVIDYRDVTYITPSTPNPFFFYKFNPTWGGTGGTRTRNDVILIDHVYISGIP